MGKFLDVPGAAFDVDDRHAWFRAEGAWARLLLLAAHRDLDPAADPLNTHRVATAFTVPVTRQGPPACNQFSQARLLLALDLNGRDSTDQPGPAFALPARLPNKARYVW